MNEKNNNKPVFQLNPLVEAQKNFDVMETRLFYLGLKDVNPHVTENDKFFDKQFPDTVIPPSELIKMFGHGQYIREVDKATDKLMGRYICIRFEDGFEKYTIFQHIKYRENKGLFIKFNEDMRPFLLDIYKTYKKYGFTKIEMQQIFYLGSAYAMRILELLLQYRGTAKNGIIEKEIDIEDLRYKLNVPDNAYIGRMCNFRQFVLDKPIKDINENTQYFISYETIKKGRNVSGFKFFCNCNNVPKDDDFKETIETQAEEVPEIEEMTPEEEKINTKLSHYGFSKSAIEALLNECAGDSEDLAARLEYAEERLKEDRKNGKNITSVSGYLHNAIVQNWLKSKNDEEEEQEQELNAVRRENERQKATIREELNKQNEECVHEITKFEIEQIKTRMMKGEDIGDRMRKRLETLNLNPIDVLNM